MRFSERVKGGADYDLADLTNLLRKDQKPDLDDMIRRVVEAIASSAKMTTTEQSLAADGALKSRNEATALIATLMAA
jgi:hypothetical protein